MTQPQDAPLASTEGALAVTVTLPWTLGVKLKTNVIVDGVRMVNAAGRNVYPLSPGRHMLSCEVNYGGSTFGQTDLAVDIVPGQTTEVFYAAPVSQRQQGRIGFTPMEVSNGRLSGCTVAIVATVALLFFAWVIVAGFLVFGTTR